MKLTAAILETIALLFAATMTWWAWCVVSALFMTVLPANWEHLTFIQVFFLLWLLRILTSVIRQPNVKISLDELRQQQQGKY